MVQVREDGAGMVASGEEDLVMGGCAGWGRWERLAGAGSMSALSERDVVPPAGGGRGPEVRGLIFPSEFPVSFHCFSLPLRRSLVPTVEFAGLSRGWRWGWGGVGKEGDLVECIKPPPLPPSLHSPSNLFPCFLMHLKGQRDLMTSMSKDALGDGAMGGFFFPRI